jgi:hypothetical protein
MHARMTDLDVAVALHVHRDLERSEAVVLAEMKGPVRTQGSPCQTRAHVLLRACRAAGTALCWQADRRVGRTTDRRFDELMARGENLEYDDVLTYTLDRLARATAKDAIVQMVDEFRASVSSGSTMTDYFLSKADAALLHPLRATHIWVFGALTTHVLDHTRPNTA